MQFMKKIQKRLHKTENSSQKSRSARTDPFGFLHAEKERICKSARAYHYDLIETAAIVTSELKNNSKAVLRLRNDEMFMPMHVKPRNTGQLVLQYLMDARDENSRQRANRAAAAMNAMLCRGVKPSRIARKLENGGVAKVLRRHRTKVSPKLLSEENDINKKTVSKSGSKKVPLGTVFAPSETEEAPPPLPEDLFYLQISAPRKEMKALLAPGKRQIECQFDELPSGWSQAVFVRYRSL